MICSRVIPPGRNSAGGSAVQSTIVDSTPIGVTTAVKNQVHAAVEIGEHVRGRGRAGAREAIRARRRHRHAAGFHQRPGHAVRRHPHGHGRQARRHRIRHRGLLRQHKGERSRPECQRQRSRRGRHSGGHEPELPHVRDVHDERVGRGAPLRLEDPLHGRRVERVGAEAVHRLGRERDQAAAANHVRGLRDHLRVGPLRIHCHHTRHRRMSSPSSTPLPSSSSITRPYPATPACAPCDLMARS